jgi:uncharacterized membrane protein
MSDKKSGFFRSAGRVINPLSPVTSFTKNVGKSVSVIKDIHTEAKERANNPTIRSWDEAIARRSADALPLEEILKKALFKKRIALFFALMMFIFWVARQISDPSLFTFLVTFHALLSTIFFLMISFKYAHQSWQIRHKNLISIKQFIQLPDWIVQTLNPELSS